MFIQIYFMDMSVTSLETGSFKKRTGHPFSMNIMGHSSFLNPNKFVHMVYGGYLEDGTLNQDLYVWDARNIAFLKYKTDISYARVMRYFSLLHRYYNNGTFFTDVS